MLLASIVSQARILVIVVSLLAIIAASPATAQVVESQAVTTPATLPEVRDQNVAELCFKAWSTTTEEIQTRCAAFVARSIMRDDELADAAATAFIDEQTLRRGALSEQAFQTRVFFYVTLVIVLCGMLASIAHLYMALFRGRDDKVDVQIDQSGFRFSTSMVGVIILIASMVFFVAYLALVYPVTTL